MDDIGKILQDVKDRLQDPKDGLTIDQRIAIAQTHAVLSVAQELSRLNPKNSSYVDNDGHYRNAWGLLTNDERNE